MSFSFNFDIGDHSNQESPDLLKVLAKNVDIDKGIDESTESKISLTIVECPIELLNIKIPSQPILNCTMGIDMQLLKSTLYNHNGLDSNYDLIPGIYGGGYKIWESSIDLVYYLLDELKNEGISADANYLELGCGQGFPGIICFKLGAQKVLFSDFNKEVILHTLWPNIILNCESECKETICYLKDRVKCIAGDWSELSLALNNRLYDDLPDKFDVIISAETLYSIESCHSLFQMVTKHLSVTGKCYIATKRYYFGVGGGSNELFNLLNLFNEAKKKSSEKISLVYKIVKTVDDGLSNIREIIRINYSTS